VSHEVGRNARLNTAAFKTSFKTSYKRGKSVRRKSAGCERVQALEGEESKDSDYLFDDDHILTTGSAFVRLYSRIVLCTFCFSF
jgi:hypothetical protein